MKRLKAKEIIRFDPKLGQFNSLLEFIDPTFIEITQNKESKIVKKINKDK